MMSLFRFSSLTLVFSAIAGSFVTSDTQAQSPAEQQAAVQRYMKIVPQIGHSVAAVDVMSGGKSFKAGGFILGESTWILTLGQFIDEAAGIKVSFKHSAALDAKIKARDPSTGLVLLEFVTDQERKTLSIASRSAKAQELQLFLDIPETAVLGMTFGTRVKSRAARTIPEVADAKMAGDTLLTIFSVPGAQKGIGTPIFNPRGEVVGMIAGIGEHEPDLVFAFSPADLAQALERMTDPNAVVEMKGKHTDATVGGKPTKGSDGDSFREWKSDSGKFSTKAKYLAQRDGKVQLQQPSGKTIVVRIDQLSAADQEFLQTQQ